MPLEVTSGDVIRLPEALVNGTTSELSAATVKGSAAKGITVSAVAPFSLKAGSRERRMLDVAVGEYVGSADFVLEASGGAFRDAVTRKLSVKPLGFPVELAYGGLLGPDGVVSYTIDIPPDVVPKSITPELAVHPTPLANITPALKALTQ